MAKTADYTRRAVDAYREKFDLVQIRLPKGTKERIQAITEGQMSVATYCSQTILDILDCYEENNAPQAPEIRNTAVVKQVIAAPDKIPGNGASDAKKVDLNDLQAQFDALQAQQKKDQEQAARLYGEADKEAARALTISREERGY